jgi:hypothetical protein
LQWNLIESTNRSGAGIVDPYVDSAKLTDSSTTQRLHIVFSSNVRRNRQSLPAQFDHLNRNLAQHLVPPGGQDYRCTRPCELQGCSTPESAGGSGNNDYLTRQFLTLPFWFLLRHKSSIAYAIS